MAMIRVLIVGVVWAAAVAAGLAVTWHHVFGIVAAVLAALAALGTWDLIQKKHSILRAYPILGHARFLAELIRPEIYGGPRGSRATSRSAPSTTSARWVTNICATHCAPASPPTSRRRCASADRTAPNRMTSRC
jgi:hypothetical protein